MFKEVRPISDTAMKILRKRYFAEGENEWKDVVKRVVDHVVGNNDDEQYQLTYDMIQNRYFIPNSPCLANSGLQNGGLLACFTLDFPDNIEGIYKTKLDFALIARKGGGCGITLSKIRPKGSKVKGSTHSHAGGPVAFANTICHDMEVVSQNGLRNMAIMLTMSVYHPDILEFITAKEEEGKLSNANMSVVIDNIFMKKVENDETYWTGFDSGSGYAFINEYKARDIFNLIVEGAWKNGEPGILFYDRMNDSPYKEEILCTNPCSEQPLPFNGSCNLGSLDVSKFLLENKTLDLESLEVATRLGVRFLDTVIDRTSYPTKEIEQFSLNHRAIGLGIMGLADYYLMREVAYGSDKSIEELEFILDFIYKMAEDESIILGEEKGIPKNCKELSIPRRNITVTTIAPTGTTSLIAGCVIGDTEIHTITGKKKIKDLIGTEQYIYCSGKDEILVRKAHDIRKTKEKAEVWKIKFDTDDELILTPDHKVMLSNGTWKRTDELKFGDSIREFHKSIWVNKDNSIHSTALYMTNLPRKFNHIAIAEYKYGRKIKKSEAVHHTDLNHLNDSIENLEILSRTKHKNIHSVGISNWSKANSGKTYEEIFGDGRAKILKENKSEKMSGEGNHRFGYLLSDEEKVLISKKTKEAMARPDIRERYLIGMKKRRSGRNHKVIYVGFHGYEDVYNMEVGEVENYVANGVIVHNCSSGIEPIFSEITIRNDKTGTYTFENNLAEKSYFRCAVSANGSQEVTWEEHIKILAAAQKHIDSGVSKTINFPNHTHRDTFAKAIMLAWRNNCKGLAMYRDKSRLVQVLTPQSVKKDKCPVCGDDILKIAGCKKCIKCDWKLSD